MQIEKHSWGVALAVMSFLTAAMPVVSAQSAGNQRTIEGTTWRTVVTPRNCQSGDATSPSLAGLFTFHQGGTMAEYGVAAGSSPAVRSPGHGVWQRLAGWQLYSFAFTFNRYNASGIFVGTQRVTGELELEASGDTFATRSVVEILDGDDVVIARFCATAAGTRFR
jgi:hypothetical protein